MNKYFVQSLLDVAKEAEMSKIFASEEGMGQEKLNEWLSVPVNEEEESHNCIEDTSNIGKSIKHRVVLDRIYFLFGRFEEVEVEIFSRIWQEVTWD